MAYNDRHLFSTGSLDLNALGEQLLFAPLNRISVHKIALRVSGTDAAGATITFARRRGASTDTTIGTVVLPAASQQGKLLYKEITTPVEVLPGDIVIATTVEAGGANVAQMCFEYSINDEDLPVGTQAVAST